MVKIGIVGCGYWGPNLIRNFNVIKNCQVLLCCDKVKERLESVNRTYKNINTTTDIDGLINNSDIDAVIIATPTQTHYGLVKDAILKGKHVFVEKPLAFSVKEAEELVELAYKHKRILMVGHTFEFNPAVVKLREYISNGDLGVIHYITSRRINLGIVREDINALWNLAPHDISILIYLLGKMPSKVKAWGSSFLQKNIEDVVFVYLYFENNITSHIHVSWLDPRKIRETTVIGSKKMIIYDDIDNEGKIRIYDKGVDRLSNSSIFGEYQMKLRAGDIIIPKIESYEPLRKECEHFIECIINGKRPLTDAENGLRVVKVLDAAQRSLENDGRVVDIAA